jgi:hypothetical protein
MGMANGGKAPKELTDKEIFEVEIKCVKRRSSGQCNGGADCGNCDLLMRDIDIISAYERAINNIDLINRQQAEIERYKETYECYPVWSVPCENVFVLSTSCDDYEDFKNQLKAEAHKEFAESFVQKAAKTTIFYTADTTIQEQETGWYQISIADFNNLVKEKE